ncbi:ATP-grasp domain-containing protein [Serratia plymuthica]|uniref:ATP-grasp domain-containing protein n=1 Tax=Serratia plymuthica TaxID=82996 RepID=UPI00045652A2|nr:ATP-grasp domain-containing protein [Serratia plymuthica]AHY08170.1 ABC transporter ATPase [Serratia plymuthica]MBL3525904.1 ATP-grasp domain-containing protein [Serratia plymuthica]OJT38750.1 ABC transporter ATP-binding protein [Serratia plymuthica]
MKKVLILAKTEYTRTPYDLWLQDSGVEPVLITSPKFYQDYARHIKHCFCLENYDHDDESLYDLTESIYQTTPFDYIFCRAEVDILRAANIRKRYSLPGQDVISALCYRDKFFMKEQLSLSQVMMADYRRIDSQEELLAFASDNGMPFVIKPRLASGSSGVVIIRSQVELYSYLQKYNNQIVSMLAEDYVDGEMFHIDGLVVEGELTFIQPFRYVNNCLSYRDNLYIGNIPLDRNDKLYSRLVSSVKDILHIMPATPHFAFHCEMWVTREDDIIFCEIASRTGGGMISFLIEEMAGFNIDKAWLLAECHIHQQSYPQYHERFLRFGCVCIPPSNGRLVSLPTEFPVEVRRTHLTGKVDEIYDGGEKSGLYLIGHVVEADDPQSVLRLFRSCYQQIHNAERWETVNNG